MRLLVASMTRTELAIASTAEGSSCGKSREMKGGRAAMRLLVASMARNGLHC